MFGCAHSRLGMVAAALIVLSPLVTVSEAAEPAPIRIGLASSLFQDVPKPLVVASLIPFKALMEAQFNVRGEMLPVDESALLAEQIDTGKMHIGVFHGVEFAWMRQKHPELKPLALAVNHHRDLYAHLVVRKDSRANSIGDLAGQTLAWPASSRLWCQVYLEQRCRACGKDPARHFASLTAPLTIEDALDDVVDGTAAATVVDGFAWECYQRRKPTRFAQLREVQKSEKFPAAVVAYRAGGFDEATLQRFRGGLIDASQSIAGKQILTIWRLTAFEPVPADYEQTLRDIVKAYPATAPAAAAPAVTQAKDAPLAVPLAAPPLQPRPIR